jgi:hypothetical protein
MRPMKAIYAVVNPAFEGPLTNSRASEWRIRLLYGEIMPPFGRVVFVAAECRTPNTKLLLHRYSYFKDWLHGITDQHIYIHMYILATLQVQFNVHVHIGARPASELVPFLKNKQTSCLLIRSTPANEPKGKSEELVSW